MRTIILTDPGVAELNWQWLPTWVGLNSQLTREIEQKITPLVKGKALTDAELDQVSNEVIKIIAAACPLSGVSDYLDGLKFVEQP
jgi:hypothetical protein